MSFVSVTFLVFVIVTVLLYFCVPKKYQRYVLLGASYFFYASYGIKYIGFILFTTVTTYIAGIQLERINVKWTKLRKESGISKEEKSARKNRGIREKRRVLACVLLANFGIWAFLKYINFIIGNVNSTLSAVGVNYHFDALQIILPLGISFYTFQAMGYLVDIYRGKYEAEKKVSNLALFISFFPQIVQGPFGRYNLLAPTLLVEHDFSLQRLGEGLRKILWGFFQKLIIADKLALPAEEIFAHFDSYNSLQILAGCFMFSIQLYADFSGYMYIVSGISKIFGVEIEENFKRPYFAQSIDEFWRRWHTSLGTWFKDYMFYPISMSKFVQNMGKRSRAKLGARIGKLIPSYFALFFVWFSTGLWHGASWKDAIWGLANCCIIIFSLQFEGLYTTIKSKLHIQEDNKLWQIFRMARTFLLVGLLRIISNSSGMSSAIKMMKRLFTEWDFSFVPELKSFFFTMSEMNIIILLVGILLLFLSDILKEKKKMYLITEKCPQFLRYCGYIIVFYIIIIFGGIGETIGGFMYAQF